MGLSQNISTVMHCTAISRVVTTSELNVSMHFARARVTPLRQCVPCGCALGMQAPGKGSSLLLGSSCDLQGSPSRLAGLHLYASRKLLGLMQLPPAHAASLKFRSCQNCIVTSGFLAPHPSYGTSLSHGRRACSPLNNRLQRVNHLLLKLFEHFFAAQSYVAEDLQAAIEMVFRRVSLLLSASCNSCMAAPCSLIWTLRSSSST